MEKRQYVSGYKAIRYKILQGTMDVNATCKEASEDEITALQLAIKKQDWRLIDFLLENNVAVNYYSPKCAPALYLAIKSGYVGLVKSLVYSHANINMMYDNNTPLHLAVDEDNYAIAEFLIKRKAEINAFNKENKTPLHIAIEKKNIKLVKLLIKNKADINVVTNNDETALIVSIKNEFFDLFKILLNAGASVNPVNNNLPPLVLAVEKNNYKITECLIKRGANLNIIYKNQTPLIIAVEQENIDILKLLIRNKADVNIESEIGTTAFSAAITKGNFVVFKILVDVIADLNSPNLLPLHSAILQNNYAFTEYLINSGANVNSLDIKQQTPLHVAVSNENIEIIKLLLDNNADVNVFDNDNLSPLSIAIIKENKEIVALLINKDKIIVEADFVSLLKIAWYISNFEIFDLLLDVGLEINPCAAHKIVPPLLLAVIRNDFETFECLIDGGAKIDASIWGKTPLHIAVERENKTMVESLVKNKADVNIDFGNGKTILNVAIEKNNFELMRILVDAGADVNYGAPLDQAIDNNSYEIVKYLVANGAKVNTCGKWKMTPLQRAVKKGNKEIIELLLKYKADVNAGSSFEPLCLTLAIENDNYDIFQLLLNARADIHSSSIGKPLIHLAVDKNNYEITKHLINCGADVNAVYDNKTPLFLAVARENEKVVELLINNKANVNQRIIYGNPLNSFSTAFYKAVEINNLNIVKILVNSPSMNVNLSSHPPLHKAIRENNYEITKYLIERGANINTPNNYGTPLNIAISVGNKEIVQLLIENKANVKSCLDSPLVAAIENDNFEILELLINTNEAEINPSYSRGYSPLHTAIIRNNYNMTEYLINNGARVNGSDIYYYSIESPLHTAVRCQYKEIVKLLIKNEANVNSISPSRMTPLSLASENNDFEIFEILLDAGALINPSSGFPPLHTAIDKNNYNMAEYLINNGACVNTSYNDKTPLQIAVRSENKEIVTLLIKNKAEVNFISESGITALGVAVEKDNFELVRMLVNIGANINLSSDEGYSPLQHAIINGSYRIAKYLINCGANINAICRCKELNIKYTRYNRKFTNRISNSHYSLLQFAVDCKKLAMVRLLIENKVDMSLVEKNNPLFLFDIIKYQSHKILELILSTRVNVDCLDTRDNCCSETLLHAAVKLKYKNIEKVKLLLMSENFNNINALTTNGKSAFHFAANEGHTSIINVLLNAGVDVNLVNDGNPGFLSWSYPGCIRAMNIQHVVKLKAANFHLNDENLKAMSDGKFNNLHAECLSEIELMKKTEIAKTNLTYYDVITKSKHRLALGLTNTNYFVKFDSEMLSLQFPLYGGMISYRLDEAQRRRQLLEKTNDILSLIFYGTLPYDVVTQVNYYLTNRDLKILTLR
ncbi:putative ankyrin repeat protein RF_0381 [Microplitis mediator]|uniref:putative ankyrin repeat protein RF_0381 n=1 Tax=Microplitis mediator TaxID=375433 RepID=UPI0025544349|nr:putative ankyrin repeat protein RF_0381 [Microplitis mediator]XP_057320545.1 putative ankyrin repeat protein RF_0381 [Microplitis mediator]XP_057320546.1 putative ankyrin repeat protein RF_0381 [Microplitis mediator]XP_057320547.1 putative ankyrin repeat protein RF_0381 [Microplitis mediator]XP_057320548.1 putative ankyrin repeat protein RF_0381 [Microplitis mediator]